MGKSASQTLALVISAIKNMRQSKGSSSRDILNYISSVHDIPQDVAKRQMVAALKRGVAHGIIKKSEGYYSVPTDTEVECMEVAAQELGLLDFRCRRRKREARKASSCKKASRVKRRTSRKSKRAKGCKSGRSRSARSRSKKRKSKKSTRGGKKSCGCKSKSRRGRSKQSGKSRGKRGSKSGCRPKRKSRRSRKGNCEERSLEDENKQKCRTVQLNVENFDIKELDNVARRSNSRGRSKSRSRSCSRNRNILPTA